MICFEGAGEGGSGDDCNSVGWGGEGVLTIMS